MTRGAGGIAAGNAPARLPGPLLIGLRCIATLGFAALGAASWHLSRAEYLARVAPLDAYARYPRSAAAASAAFRQALGRNPQYTPTAGDLENARAAVAEAPLSPSLLMLRSLRAAQQGQGEIARRAVQASGHLTRRDALTEFALIEDAAAHGDVRQAVRHYNAAMSVSPTLAAALVPTLAGALAFPDVRAAVVPFLARGARWGPALLAAAVDVLKPGDLADFLRPLTAQLSGPAYHGPVGKALDSLARRGRSDLVLDLAPRLWPGVSRTAIASAAFDPALREDATGNLGWALPQDDAIASWIDEQGALHAEVAPFAGGMLARRDIMVDPGRPYRLRQTLGYPMTGASAQMKWAITCLSAPVQPVWEQAMPVRPGATTYEATLKVPPGCHVVRLEARVIGGEGQRGRSLTISGLRLEEIH